MTPFQNVIQRTATGSRLRPRAAQVLEQRNSDQSGNREAVAWSARLLLPGEHPVLSPSTRSERVSRSMRTSPSGGLCSSSNRVELLDRLFVSTLTHERLQTQER
jgi:hypothetical protein